MGRIYEKRDSLSREIDRRIWEYVLYTLERQPGKKKDTDDYQFKSCILGQKAGLLTSGRSPPFGSKGEIKKDKVISDPAAVWLLFELVSQAVNRQIRSSIFRSPTIRKPITFWPA